MRPPGRAPADARHRAGSRSATPVPDHSVQSSSSAVAPSSSCRGCRATSAATARGPLRLGAVEPVEATSGRPPRGRTSSRDGVGQPLLGLGRSFSRCRSRRARRRTSPASRPPSGPAAAPRPGRRRRSRRGRGRRCRGCSTARRASISGSAAGSRTSGQLVAGHLDRDAGGTRESGAAAGWSGGPTAPARPSRPTRCRPRGARGAAGRPGARPRPGRCRRCGTTTRPSPCDPASADGDRNAARGLVADAAGQPDPAGHALGGGEQAAARTAGWCPAPRPAAGAPSAVRERASGSRGCRAPRRPGRRRSTGAGRPPRPGCGRRRPAPRSSATWPESVSWYSSTKTWLNSARSSSRCGPASMVARRIRSA